MRLMPAQYVKPYVKTNKNDYIDAEAIAEAVGRARMRFVPIKTDDQLDLQSLHRVRERWVSGRTAVINQIRGLLLERGVTIRKGRRHIEESLPGILEDAHNKLSGALRVSLTELRLEMQYLQRQVNILFVVGHMCHKFHGGVALAAKVSAFPLKVANFFGSDSRLGRMILCRLRVYLQIWNDEAVRNILGSDYNLDCFAFLERNLRWGEGKALCVNLNGSRRILRSGSRNPLDEDDAY
jgi:hypothetical protein